MLFNSYVFLLLFLPLCLIGYFLCNKKEWYRAGLVVLGGMSLVFYAYDHVQYLPVIVLSIFETGCFQNGLYVKRTKKQKLF